MQGLRILVSVIILSLFAGVSLSKTGRFPNLFNIAKGKPIFAQPAQSTCSRLFFCRSTPHASSITSCSNAEFCDSSCPTRSTMPNYADLFEYTLLNGCAFKDSTFKPPSNVNNSVYYSLPTSVAENCSTNAPGNVLTHLKESPKFFTLTLWLSPDFLSEQNASERSMTLVQKVCNDENNVTIVFSVHINSTSIIFEGSSGKLFAYNDDTIFQSNSWTHLAIQVSNESLSFFINGTADDLLPLIMFRLHPEDIDSNSILKCSFYLGHPYDKHLLRSYTGHMADVRYYETTLDNREIVAVFEGQHNLLREVYIDSKCRCPAKYPRIADNFSRLCLTNDPTSRSADVRVNRRAHPLEFMTDGDTATFWLSKLINKVVVTIDFLDYYQVFYILFQFYSPLPKKLVIEKENEITGRWEPWQYYADDCRIQFDMQNNGRLHEFDAVNCIQLNRKNSPYSLGNVSFNALQLTPAQRPGATTFFENTKLLEFIRTRRIRVTFDGHMYDQTDYINDRHLYFGVFELTASGRCDCNGQASSCSISDDSRKYTCNCEGNTAGRTCDRCEDLFNAKPYRKSLSCSACACNGHSSSCVYNATLDEFADSAEKGDGGVCVNCGGFTEGRNCEICKDGYYRFETASAPTDPCYRCTCDLKGTIRGAFHNCSKNGGHCQCKANVEGKFCERCKPGFYGLSALKPDGCSPCSCSQAGVISNIVDCDQVSGRCACKTNVYGSRCDTCKFGYHSLSIDNPLGCEACQCDPVGSSSIFCDTATGQCPCRKNVEGKKCSQCAPRYYNLTISGCSRCQCNHDGVKIDSNIICDPVTGNCICRTLVTGKACDVCMDGSAQFGIDAITGCIECRCSTGTRPGETCDKDTGVCACRKNVAGLTCNLCKPSFWNLTSDNPDGCQPCGCDLTGARANCDQNTGRCTCMPNRIGLKCNTCEQGFTKAKMGCKPCECSNLTSSGRCDPDTGQCQCRLDRLGVGGKSCRECIPGFHGFNETIGECKRCDCFWPGVRGGVSTLVPCDSRTGQCYCKEYVTGQKCDQCKEGFSILKDDNPFGCSASPSQQPPPRFIISNSSAISINWSPPLKPNGIIRFYSIFRNGTFVDNVTAMVDSSENLYTDIGLKPLHYYEYRIMAFTDFGNTTSIGAVFSTMSGAPNGNLTFDASRIEATSIVFAWEFIPSESMMEVEKENLQLRLHIHNQSSTAVGKIIWQGNDENSTKIGNLEPFSPYLFKLEICNIRLECSIPSYLNVTTNEAPPELQPEPRVTALSTDSIYVEWDPPQRPNGVITFYELWQKEVKPVQSWNGTNEESSTMLPSSTKRILVFHPSGMWIRDRNGTNFYHSPSELPLPPPDRNFTVSGLVANRRYEFQIVAQNSVGKVESEWAGAFTHEAPPSRPLQPDVTPVSSTELLVTWPDPALAAYLGGVTMNITIYSVRQSRSQYGPPVSVAKEISQSPEMLKSIVLKRISPYTVVGVMLQVCTRLSCINSTVVNGTTLSAPPLGIAAPNATGNTSTAILLEWREPVERNGPKPFYAVSRVLTSFSEPPIQVERGIRFPGLGYMKFSPYILPLSTPFLGVRLFFKTKQKSALLFLTVSEGEEEVVAIQIFNGKPYVLVDPDGCRRSGQPYAVVSTASEWPRLSFSDNSWHNLTFIKDGENMRLTLDDSFSSESTISCAEHAVIGNVNKVFVGGVPFYFDLFRNRDPAVQADETLRVVLNSLTGCLKDVAVLTSRTPSPIWTPLEWYSAIESTINQELAEGCPVTLSPGVHFLGEGFAIMPSVAVPMLSTEKPSPTNFGGGKNFEIKLMFRSEFRSGLLYFQYSKNTQHMLFVQINDSALEVGIVVGSNVDMINVEITRLTHMNFCDTKPKTVVISKKGTQLDLETKDAVSRPFKTSLTLKSEYFVLSSDIFLGGLGGPETSAREFIDQPDIKRYIVKETFGGCFLDFDVKSSDTEIAGIPSVPILSYISRYGNTSSIRNDGCPTIVTKVSKSKTCVEREKVIVYQGDRQIYLDYGLSSFTTYLYSLNASNVAGYSLSLWRTGRTLPLPPNTQDIRPPRSVKPVSGRAIRVEWYPPRSYSGMLTAYIISAITSLDKKLQTEVTIKNPGPKDLSATIGGLKPHTTYLFYVTVCNSAGCAKGRRPGRNQTMSEAPEGMDAPVVAERRPWSLFLQWDEPRVTNGELTGYQLFKNGIRIYGGQLMRFNVTGLKVATANRYAVEACTVTGCVRSDEVILTTSALPPPAPIPAPLVTPMTSTEVRVAWLPVDSSNGIIERYKVYMSLRPKEPLATSIIAIDNETNPTTFLVDELTPGTEYFFRLTACTNGGCTTSAASSALTFEAPPENLRPLTIVSSEPSKLDVFWEPPLNPNGIITNYLLIHNGRQVLNQLEPRHFSLSGLPPHSRNDFLLKACNREGCISGNKTVAYSLEDVPEGVLVLDPIKVVNYNTIKIQFWGPELPNGVMAYSVLTNGLFLDKETNSVVFMTKNIPGQKSMSVANLMPASNYTIQVNASNSRGYVLSNIRSVRLPKGPPQGFLDPIIQSVDANSISVRWKPAAWSNGDPVMGPDSAVYMLQYKKYDDPDSEIENAFSYPVTGTMYVMSNLEPFSRYLLRVITSNSVTDSIYSNWVEAMTSEDCPKDQPTPEVDEIAHFYINISWNPPTHPNGFVVNYSIFVNEDQFAAVNLSDANSTSYVFSNAFPNQWYQFTVQSCTSVCCKKSSPSPAIQTPPAKASGLNLPTVIADTPTSVILTWKKPLHPNGKMLAYVLERNAVIIANLSAENTTDLRHVDRGLLPYTRYEYRVWWVNEVGTAKSEPITVRTKPARPIGVLPPQFVNPIDPYSVSVAWQPPYRPNGRIEKYVLRVSSLSDESLIIKVDQAKARPRERDSKEASDLSRIITDLRPYTQYNITVSACSDGGGCTESPELGFRTLPSNPEDQPAPVATAISQTSIFVQWLPPLKPNSIIKIFTLDRLITRMPLEPINNGNEKAWETIFIGNQTYFEDNDLSIFTYVQYRVTAISDYGRATSVPSAENCTFGEEPFAAPELQISNVNHDSVNISWTNLTVDILRGKVDHYLITLQHERKPVYLLPKSTNHLSLLVRKTVPGHQFSVLFTDLIPSTAYTVMMTMKMYGGISKKAVPIRVATADGTPTGLRTPTIRTLSETQLRLLWFPPMNSNGRILKYIVYVDDQVAKVILTDADGTPMATYAHEGDFTAIISGLKPFTVHSIILSACTKFACGNSTEMLATTVEAPPKDMPTPQVVARGATWLAVRFSEPESPNGKITRYDLFRKSTDHCPSHRNSARYVKPRVAKRSLSDFDHIVPVQANSRSVFKPSYSKTCSYVACPNGHWQCGGVCYASNSSLTCCQGELYETRVNFVCCDSNYVPVSEHDSLDSKVCCGGRLHSQVAGYKCCYGNYVNVPSGSTCCYNSVQRNVIVSLGETCCSSVPYRPDEFTQVCFGGVLLNRPDQKPCGRRLIPSSNICCSTSNKLGASADSSEPLPDHECCGDRYYNTSRSICCSKGRRFRLHEIDEFTTESTCCGLKLIPSELSCCNGKPFNRRTAICADTAYLKTESGEVAKYQNCGRGKICPTGSSAMCDQCDFAPSEQICYVEQHESMVAEFTAEITNSGGWPRGWNGPLQAPVQTSALSSWCEPRYIRLYSNATHGTFNDTNLKPYTRYEYFAQVSNAVGALNSSIVMAATADAPPAGLQPPRIISNPDQLNVLRLNWDPPLKPNGAPIFYKLYRDDVLIFSGDTRSFVDSTDVAPFQTYTYWLIACNQVACVSSNRVPAASLESIPEDFDPPSIHNINSTCVNVTWNRPAKPNGLITKYIVTLRERNTQNHGKVPLRDMTVHTAPSSASCMVLCGLKPYFNYQANMEACTQVGCRPTEWKDFLTLAALPVEIPEPRVLVVNFIHIDVFWRLPYSANGPISQTTLYRKREGEFYFSKMVSYNLTIPNNQFSMNYSDFSVKPGYRYIYKVEHTNPAGKVNSSQVTSYGVPLRPPEIPSRIPSAVSVQGPRKIAVIGPSDNNSLITKSFDEVIVLIEVDSGVEREHFNGLSAEFDHLSPYTLYEARIKLCFKPPESSCSYGNPVFVRTEAAPPDSPPKPAAMAKSAKSVVITWAPPLEPNGPIDRYEIYRRKMGGEMTMIATVPVVIKAFEESSEDPSENEYIDSDEKLRPFTTYEYRVAAVTSAGRGLSHWVTVRTSQAPPSMLRPPMVNQTGPYGAEFVWSPPQHSNGPLLKYIIEFRRINADPFSDFEMPAHSFVVSPKRNSVLISGLKPYSSYSARLATQNSVGTIESDWITFATPEAAPTNLPPITVEQAMTGVAVTLRWEEPLSPNGRITRYALYDVTKAESLLWTGSGRVFEYRRLKPFTAYSVMLEACTNAGCSKTQPQTFRTAEAPPDLLDPPVIKQVNENSVKLKWNPPKMPNGEFIVYELLRFEKPLSKNAKDDVMDKLFEADMRRKTYASTTTSSPHFSKHRRSVGLSQNDYLPSRLVSNKPADAGEDAKIVYRVTADANGGSFSFVDDDLKPFTRFHYRLRARNSRGLVEIDGNDIVETAEAVPNRVEPPELVEASVNELKFKWQFPTEVNGLLRSISICRQETAANNRSSQKTLVDAYKSRDFVDREVEPNQEYMYALEACTLAGCNMSRWIHVRTPSPPPDMYRAPTVSDVNSTAATIYWKPPKNVKVPPDDKIKFGDVVGYRISVNDTALSSLVPASKASFTLKNLRPFHFYLVAVSICIAKPYFGGENVQDRYLKFSDFSNDKFLLCGAYSRPAAIETKEDNPKKLAPPKTVAISSSAIDIQWRPPADPNGFIIEYTLYRNDSPICYCDACFSYTDYDLEPATHYVYVVSARNRIGVVTSRPSNVRTSISTPDGMAPPNVKALSPNNVLVTWERPVKSNGEIVNFTVYLNSTDIGYTGLERHAYIGNLKPFTTYDFCVEACTTVGCARSTHKRISTPESPPEGIDAPTLLALADFTGQHNGVRASWFPPRRPNGIIQEYRLERRKIFEHRMASGNLQTVVGAPVFVYNGSDFEFIERDSPGSLEAFTVYEYRVTAVNTAGRTSSEWQFGRIQTEQAVPDLIRPPVVASKSPTKATIEILPPELPNGYITDYRLFLNGVISEHRNSPGFTELEGLNPNSAYLVHVEACTVVGCKSSAPVGFKTSDAAPSGLEKLEILQENATQVVVKWKKPAKPNGNITRYSIIFSTDCHPAVRQPISPLCHPFSRNFDASDNMEYVLSELQPFSQYTVSVRVTNSLGYSSVYPSQNFTTAAEAPAFLKPPRVVEDIFPTGHGKIRIYWNESFALNSQLLYFNLLINKQPAYEGRSTSTSIFAERDVYAFSVSIAAVTESGIAKSPISEFSLASRNPVLSPSFISNRPTSTQQEKIVTIEPPVGIFEQPWFVIGISLVGLVSGIGLIVCACRRCCIESGKRKRLLAEAARLALSPSPSGPLREPSFARSSMKYVRQKAALANNINTAKRSASFNIENKRQAPKPPVRRVSNTADFQESFSLRSHPKAYPGALALDLEDDAPKIFNIAKVEHQHEAPCRTPSISSLHIEVSGTTATGEAYGGVPFIIGSESSSVMDYVNTSTSRHLQLMASDSVSQFNIWSAFNDRTESDSESSDLDDRGAYEMPYRC